MEEASHNLISIGDLDDLGCRIVIDNGIMTIKKNENTIVSIEKENNVWFGNSTEIFNRVLDNCDNKQIKQMWWLSKRKEDDIVASAICTDSTKQFLKS